MLNVFICDDIESHRLNIKSITENVIMIDNLDMEIVLTTENPKDILNRVANEKNTGLYFLDADLKADITGIELAEKIREYDPRGFIVIITAYIRFLPFVFKHKIEALDFIDKSDFQHIRDRIESCIRTAYKRYATQTSVIQNVLTIKWDDKIISIEYKDIISIETSPNKNDHLLILNTPDSRYIWPCALRHVEKRLDKRFIRISQSYIINRGYILEFNPKTRVILLSNGGKYMVPIHRINELSKILLETAPAYKLPEY